MGLPVVKNNFTSGEIAPLLRGRIELKVWRNGAKSLRNCFVLPQGGFRRRDGLRWCAEHAKTLTRVTAGVTITAPNGGITGNANDDNEATYLITTTLLTVANPYVVVQYDLGVARTVKFADVVRFRNDANAINNADFFIQYSDDAASWTTLGTAIPCSANTINQVDATVRRRHANVSARYWRFARIGAVTYSSATFSLGEFNLWTEDATLSDGRIADFTFSTTQRYAVVFSDRNARVFIGGVYQADIRTNFTSAQMGTLNWTQSLDTMVVVHEDVAPMKFLRSGSDAEWHSQAIVFDEIPNYAYVLAKSNPAVTLTPSAVSGNITLTTGAGFWVAGHVDQIVDANFGRARIVEVTSTTVAKAIVLVPFFNTTAIASGGWILETGYEDVWSATRGYPSACIFRQNRLVLGGFKSLPNAWAASRNAEFFDFGLGQGLDDEGIFFIIQADDVPAIYAFKAERQLQIFTSSSEYYVPQAPGAPLTPRTVECRRSTSRGSKRGIRPVNISGSTIFLEAGGKTFREFVWAYEEDAHVTPDISFHGSHLVNDPVDLCLRRAPDKEHATQLFAVNPDGTLVACSLMPENEVNAWSPQDTIGAFKRCGTVDSDCYVLVDRTVGGVSRRYVEIFDEDLLLDSAVSYGRDGPALSGLNHLEGLTIKVRGDDATLSDEIVVGGQVTADRAFTTAGQAGLYFAPDVDILDVNDGNRIGRPRRISRVTLDLFETQNITVKGNKVPFRKFAEGAASPLDKPPPIFTGIKVVDGILGWSRQQSLPISQDEPAPMTVRSLEYEIR